MRQILTKINFDGFKAIGASRLKFEDYFYLRNSYSNNHSWRYDIQHSFAHFSMGIYNRSYTVTPVRGEGKFLVDDGFLYDLEKDNLLFQNCLNDNGDRYCLISENLHNATRNQRLRSMRLVFRKFTRAVTFRNPPYRGLPIYEIKTHSDGKAERVLIKYEEIPPVNFRIVPQEYLNQFLFNFKIDYSTIVSVEDEKEIIKDKILKNLRLSFSGHNIFEQREADKKALLAKEKRINIEREKLKERLRKRMEELKLTDPQTSIEIINSTSDNTILSGETSIGIF